MPFDTTYHIQAANGNITYTVKKPGGIDTTIFLGPDHVPSDIDSSLAGADSLFRIVQQSFPLNQAESEYKSRSGDSYVPLFLFLTLLIGAAYIRFRQNMRTGHLDNESLLGDEDNAQSKKKKNYLTYYGDQLNIADEKLNSILSKRFPYFSALNSEHKEKFLHRLRNFMSDKTFKIHNDTGFVEMPVLISAAAIQLTFGLSKYLLPYFQYIHVYPQEFMRTEPVLCLLEGNVSGHRINLSWKHFLEGYENPANGQNVGLHEMAHALYYQTFIVEENVDNGFRNQYDEYLAGGNKVYEAERSAKGGLYSEYGEQNPQEFWAESIELFFEKPVAMQAAYPELYESLKQLLNQDPVNKISMVR